MKLVAKYTLVLGTLLVATLAVLAFYRVEGLRGELEHDVRRDHRVVGRVLQAGAVDVWLARGEGPGSRELANERTQLLIQRANENDTSTRFEWISGATRATELQAVERGDFVSRFPVRSGDELMGVIVAREPLAYIDRLVHAQIVLSVVGIASILVLGLIASLVLGRWLVGRPVALLVEQARRIGRRELTNEVAFHRSDELGELATEMAAASRALADALARTAAETDARVKAVDQLRHSDRLSTVGKLAAGIAHELGTPLSIVGGHAQMIAGGEVTGEAALESARAIDREVTRIGRIVRQLLDFARRKGPEGTSCEPGDVARRCASLLAPMAERGRVRLEVEVADPLPRALIDEDSLQQVITNLIVNAIQAMPDGGTLRVALSTATARPPDGGGAPAACVRIEVSDTGSGIPEAVKVHIFEPFFTTKQVGEGTGLGLAVVYGIVVDHRGWITVETSERGTAFSIYLQEADS